MTNRDPRGRAWRRGTPPLPEVLPFGGPAAQHALRPRVPQHRAGMEGRWAGAEEGGAQSTDGGRGGVWSTKEPGVVLCFVHRSVESFTLKKTSQIPRSNPSPPAMPTVPQCHIPTALERLHGRSPHRLPGQLCHCSTALHEEKCFSSYRHPTSPQPPFRSWRSIEVSLSSSAPD